MIFGDPEDQFTLVNFLNFSKIVVVLMTAPIKDPWGIIRDNELNSFGVKFIRRRKI